MADCSYKEAVDKKKEKHVYGYKQETYLYAAVYKFTKEKKKAAKEEPFFAGKHKPTKRAAESNIFFCMQLFSLFAVRKRIWMGGEEIENETDAECL